jgi:hypothetical protein
MDHPEFTNEHWLDTFRAHVKEIHARGHRLTLRQAEMPMDLMEQAFAGSNAKFDVEDEVDRLNQKPNPTNVTYTQVPVNSKEILEGMITGIGGVFVPGLKDAENGTEALTTFQQCFDPRKLHETFVVKDFFKAQDELPGISDADLDAFQQSIESMDKANGGISAQTLLKRFEALQLRTWRTWKYLAAILKKLGPYLLQLIKHSSRCGVLDIVIGFALSFILPFFPPILLILIAVAAMAFELFSQIKAAVDNWYKNWFKFGKAVGAILAFVASLIIAYKMGKSNEIKCTGGKQKGCTYEMPKNEMNNWQPPKAKKVCGGELCNPVMQRNDIIDPYRLDDKGRTNIMRMKDGVAAIGPDGKSINLHHIYQTPDGPIAELTDTFHSVNHGELHKFLKHGEPSRIDRAAFDIWRSAYWRQRGQDMDAAIKAGETLATFGASVPNWAPVAATAITKSWDAIKGGAPSVGAFLGEVIDAIANGDKSSKVTSAKDGMDKLDVVRLILLALKGKVTSSADKMDAEMMSAAAMQREESMQCSLDANCTEAVPIDATRFDRVDGLVQNGVQKKYVVHFAPDTGFALSVSTFVNEGGARVRIANGGAAAALAGGADMRQSEKKVVAGELEAEFAAAEHRVTLQHCDGYGDYSVELAGDRAALTPADWASDDANETIRAFWAANGAPPDMNKSIYTVGAQYVPYPVVAGARVSRPDGGLVLRVPAASGASRYHVLVAPVEAPAVATVCDVLRVARRAQTVTIAAGASSVDVTLEQPDVASRAYVIAESDAGAMALHESDNGGVDGEAVSDQYATALPKPINVGAAIGITVAVVVLLALIGLLVLAFKKGWLARFRRA